MTRTNPTITLETTIVAIPDQVSSDLQGEAVILSLRDGTYYGLNEVGARIWRLIQQPIAVRTICATLLEEYDVEPAQCERDLLTLLDDLAAHNLIEVQRAVS